MTLDDLISKYSELTSLINTSTKEVSDFVDSLIGTFSQADEITTTPSFLSEVIPPQDLPVVSSLDRKESLQESIDTIQQQVSLLSSSISKGNITYTSFSSYLRDILENLSGIGEGGEAPEVLVEAPPQFTESSVPEAPSFDTVPEPVYEEKEAESERVDNVISLVDYFEEVNLWYSNSLEFIQNKISEISNLDLADISLDIEFPSELSVSDTTLEYLRAELEDDKEALARLNQVISSIGVENLAEDSAFTLPQEVRSAIDDTYKENKRGLLGNTDKIALYEKATRALKEEAMKGWPIPTGEARSAVINAQVEYFLKRQSKLQEAFTKNATFLTDKVIATYLNYFKKTKLLADMYGLNAFMLSQFNVALLELQRGMYKVLIEQLNLNIQNVVDTITNYQLTLRAIADKGRVMVLTATNKALESQVKIANIQSEISKVNYLRAQVDAYRADIDSASAAITNQIQKAALYSLYVKMFSEKVRLYDAQVTDYNTKTKNSFLSSILFKFDSDFRNYKTKAVQGVASEGVEGIKQYLARLDKYYSLVTGQEISSLEASMSNLRADIEILAQEISNENYRLEAQGQLNQEDLDIKLSLLRTQLAGYSKDITLALETSEKELHSKITALASYDSAYALYLNRKIANILQSVRASVSMVTKLFEEI
jgi:KaiC/GvpD/RAD55 family RecA-like ATPase